MPKFRLTITKTETRVSRAEKIIDLPTDDLAKAQAYGEVACGFGNVDSKSPLQYASFRAGDPIETMTVTVDRAPATEDDNERVI